MDVSLSQGVTIAWRDGHRSHYGVRYLRERCPCATCSGAHGDTSTRVGPAEEAANIPANPLVIFKPLGSTLKDAKPVGRYALQFQFSDDHATGIFTWTYLREICPCEQCRTRGGERD